jgi:hypothetical protein
MGRVNRDVGLVTVDFHTLGLLFWLTQPAVTLVTTTSGVIGKDKKSFSDE